jgi:hypothetical protein
LAEEYLVLSAGPDLIYVGFQVVMSQKTLSVYQRPQVINDNFYNWIFIL